MRVQTRGNTESGPQEWSLSWPEALQREGIYERKDPDSVDGGRAFYVVIGEDFARRSLIFYPKRNEICVVSESWDGCGARFRRLKGAELLFDVIEA
jgi:hypothetical protein